MFCIPFSLLVEVVFSSNEADQTQELTARQLWGIVLASVVLVGLNELAITSVGEWWCPSPYLTIFLFSRVERVVGDVPSYAPSLLLVVSFVVFTAPNFISTRIRSYPVRCPVMLVILSTSSCIWFFVGSEGFQPTGVPV